MSITKKYTINPSTDSLVLSNSSRFETTSKVEANKKAKFWIEQGIKDINYNIDTFENGKCTKNEFGKFENGKVRIYSTISYKLKKTKKFEPKITNDVLKQFFNFDKSGNPI